MQKNIGAQVISNVEQVVNGAILKLKNQTFEVGDDLDGSTECDSLVNVEE